MISINVFTHTNIWMTWKNLLKLFHSSLSIVDITDADQMHAKRVYKDFKINNLGEYHEFYIQNYTYC